MNKKTLIWGAVLGLLTVAFGAFGAHALKALLLENGKLEVFNTAVQYQSFHALALLGIGVLFEKIDSKWLMYSAYLMIGGVILFSGSLYLLSITNVSMLGIITPFGGVLLMLGWVSLIVGIVKK